MELNKVLLKRIKTLENGVLKAQTLNGTTQTIIIKKSQAQSTSCLKHLLYYQGVHSFPYHHRCIYQFLQGYIKNLLKEKSFRMDFKPSQIHIKMKRSQPSCLIYRCVAFEFIICLLREAGL